MWRIGAGCGLGGSKERVIIDELVLCFDRNLPDQRCVQAGSFRQDIPQVEDCSEYILPSVSLVLLGTAIKHSAILVRYLHETRQPFLCNLILSKVDI